MRYSGTSAPAEVSWPAVVLPLLICLAAAAYWLWLYFTYGREPAAEGPSEEVTQPPADWSPTRVAYLWQWGELQPKDMLAALLDLVHRGALQLASEPADLLIAGGVAGVDQEYEFVVARVPDREGDLSESDRYLVDRVLFHYAPKASHVSLRETIMLGARDGVLTCERFDHWKELAERECAVMTPLEDPLSKRMAGRAVTTGLVVAGLSLLIGVALKSVLCLLQVGVGGLLAVGSQSVRRRNPEAAAALRQWQAYRRRLATWEAAESLPASHIVLEGRPLAYALTFGLAARAFRELRLLYPDQEAIANSADYWR